MLREPGLRCKGVKFFEKRFHDDGDTTRFSVRVNTRHNVRSAPVIACYNFHMIDEWYQRLEEVVRADRRSMRRISEDAKLGQNFVQQLIRDRKDPRASQLHAIFEALGPGTDIFVITGLRLSPPDLEFLRVAAALDPELRRDAMSLLRRMTGTQSAREQQPVDEGEGSSKAGTCP